MSTRNAIPFAHFPVPRWGEPTLILAPMEGVTDAPMRALQTERGGFAFCVSEFLRVSQEIPPPKVFLRHVPELNHGGLTPSGTPVQVQLLGGNPARLAASAQRAVALGAKAIDLNFGCPAPTVNRNDGGATLLKYPKRIREIVAAVRQAVPAEIPVSAKLRLGWDKLDDINLNAESAALGGANWITIHARTRVAGYAPPAYWGYLRRVREALPIPVVANGDIWTLEDFYRCREESGCEHFMLGRGALADPNLTQNISAILRNAHPRGVPFGKDHATWKPLLQRFADLLAPHSTSPAHSVRRIKQWVSLTHRRGSTPWFDQIKRKERLEEILAPMTE